MLFFKKFKLQLIGGSLLLIFVGGLFTAYKVKASQLNQAILERDLAQETVLRANNSLRNVLNQHNKLTIVLEQRDQELKKSREEASLLKRELQTISVEVSDEKWQNCRNVVVPDVLIDRLLQ